MTTTVTLFPGTITTMLGSPTIDTGAWSDATDDTTSVQLSQSWNGTTFTRFDRVKGLLSVLDSSLGTPVAIRVKMRASGSQSDGPAGGPLNIQANIALTNTPNSPFVRVGDTNQSGSLHWQVVADIGITGDYSIDLASDAPTGGVITGGDFYAANFTSMASVVSMLQTSGAVLQAQVDILTPQSHTLSNTLVIYALWVEVDFEDVDPLPCDTWVDLDLSTATFENPSGDQFGQYVDGVIVGLDGNFPQFSFPFDLDPVKRYRVRVTFDPDSTHDGGGDPGGLGDRWILLRNLFPGDEVTGGDSVQLGDGFDNTADVCTLTIGPGVGNWDDPDFGVTQGYTRLLFQTSETGAVSGISVRKVCKTVPPPLRQYPRSDGLGASSARRVWPVPNTIQASNRRGPSAIL